MQMLVEFDVSADIIEVPSFVVEKRKHYRKKFLDWLYNPAVKHSYWVKSSSGWKGVCFGTDAFVEWLNKKVLKHSDEKAVVVQRDVSHENSNNLPSIFF